MLIPYVKHITIKIELPTVETTLSPSQGERSRARVDGSLVLVRPRSARFVDVPSPLDNLGTDLGV